MIASSFRVKLFVGWLAVAAHGAAGVALAPRQEVQMESGAGEVAARIGTSFADMAAGTLTSRTSEDAAPAEAAPPPEPVAALRPEAPAPSPVPAPLPAPEAAAPLPPAKPDAAPAKAPSASAAPETPEPLAAIEASGAALATSPRPVQRSAQFEERNKPPEPRAAPQPVPQPRTAPGNAETNATAGSTQGREDATAKQQGSAAAAANAAGTAAASNYPGAVMAKISGVRKPTLRQSGAARVSFSIAASGALAEARIARSSGAAELDREALRLIQRAAPFPAPPPGAERSFALDIEFR